MTGASARFIFVDRHPADGSRRGPVLIWIVRVGDKLFFRSYRSAGGAWFWHAQAQPEGRIRAGGIERDLSFDRPDSRSRARGRRRLPGPVTDRSSEHLTGWRGLAGPGFSASSLGIRTHMRHRVQSRI